MIIETKVQLNSVNWQDFYDEGYDGDVTLSVENVYNWDDVVENIKDSMKKEKVKRNGRLSGDEYPPDTPIVLSPEFDMELLIRSIDGGGFPDHNNQKESR